MSTETDINKLLELFVHALSEVDARGATEGGFKPGIGPHNENHMRDFIQDYLVSKGIKAHAEVSYPNSESMNCDLVITDEFAIEFKILRPLGNNGLENSTEWFSNVVYPSKKGNSSVSDAYRLSNSEFTEVKLIVILCYYPKHDLEIQEKVNETLNIYEIVCRHYGIELAPKHEAHFNTLIHPVHSTGRVVAYEVN